MAGESTFDRIDSSFGRTFDVVETWAASAVADDVGEDGVDFRPPHRNKDDTCPPVRIAGRWPAFDYLTAGAAIAGLESPVFTSADLPSTDLTSAAGLEACRCMSMLPRK